MEMHNRDPSVHEQNPRALDPIPRRKHGPRRRPIEALLLETIHSPSPQTPPNHPTTDPKLCHHEFEKSGTTIPRFHQNGFHWQTRSDKQPRKPGPRPNIDPSPAHTSQTLCQCDHPKALRDLLRQRRKVLRPTQIHGPPKSKPLLRKSLQLLPRHLTSYPDRRNA